MNFHAATIEAIGAQLDPRRRTCAFCGEPFTPEFKRRLPGSVFGRWTRFCSWSCYKFWREERDDLLKPDYDESNYAKGETAQ